MRNDIYLGLTSLLVLPVITLAQTAPALPAPAQATISVDFRRPVKQISPDLFGIFFEDINYAADGGLYGELLQNRSFEYSPAEQLKWNEFTPWEIITRGTARGSASINISIPQHPNNPHYVVLEVAQSGDASAGVGLMNPGFDGIPVTRGESYDLAFFASIRFLGNRWGGPINFDTPFHFVARLEKADGTLLAQAPVEVSGRPWNR